MKYTDGMELKMPVINNGLNLGLEYKEQDGSEHMFGAFSKASLVTIPQNEREAYLPQGEVQGTDFTDTYGCASRGPLNILAPLFTYGYRNGTFSQNNLRWLQNKWYVDTSGKIDFSDGFVEIGSGTTKAGNSLKAPLDFIHNSGLIPKWMLPLNKNLTFEQYYDPKRITQEMKDLGKEFARRFTISYEQTPSSTFPTVLKNDLIDTAAYAWPDPINGVYPATKWNMNHCFMIFKFLKYYNIFDNYQETPGDFIKLLAPNYNFFDWGYRVFISAEDDTIDEQISRLQELVKYLTKILEALRTKANQTVGRMFVG